MAEIAKTDLQRIAALAPLFSEANARSVRQDDADERISRLVLTLDETGFTEVFNWQAWMEEQGLMGDGGHQAARLTDADLDTLRKTITAHIRMNRFVGGHLEGLVQNGYIEKFLGRVGELAEQA